jgi:hypothetical protein
MRRPDGFIPVRSRHAVPARPAAPEASSPPRDRLLFRYHPGRGVVEVREGGRLLQVDLTSLQATGGVVELE